MGSGRAVWARAAVAAAAGWLLAGCAQVGPVLPPSAGIPAVVGDFAAQRQGPVVRFTWTTPTRTSDGVALKAANLPLRYALCVWPLEAAWRGHEQSAPPLARPRRYSVAGLPPVEARPQATSGSDPARGGEPRAGATLAACPHVLPLADHAMALAQLAAGGGFVSVALGAENAAGESAGWSNRVTVPLTAVAVPPVIESATPSAAGVTLRWRWPPQPADAAAPAAAVIRDDTVLAQVPAGLAGAEGDYLDASAAVDQHYSYWLRSSAGQGAAQVVSGDSTHLQVDTADVFPPPVPMGVEAVATPTGVELSWNTAPPRDLAGYNVYRQVGDGPWQKRNQKLVSTPAFLDSAAPAGARYAVTAVDQAGNESARSAAIAPR